MSEAKRLPQYVAAITICIGAWGTGTVLGWTSNITADLKSGRLNGLKMDIEHLEWAGSCCTLGAMLICFPIGFIADCIGRKATCLATVIPSTLGWLLIIFSNNFLMVYIGRVLTGAAGGAFLVVAPIYTTEIAQTHIRGTLGTFVQLFLVLGVLHDNILGWALPMMAYNIACLSVPIVFGILFLFQPESPFYNLKKGKMEKAEKNLKRLRGANYDFAAELALIHKEIEEETAQVSLWTDLKTNANKKALVICLMLMVYQQLTGVNALSFYCEDILIQSGTSIPVHFGVMLTGITGFFATILSVSLIDTHGRTFLLYMSCAICAFSTFSLAMYFYLKNNSNLEGELLDILRTVPPFAIMLFCIGFNLGLGPIPWIAPAELCSPRVKQVMSSLAGTVNWLVAFLVTRYCLTLEVLIGVDNTFYIFTCITISCIGFIYIFVPETNGKRYDKIKEELER